jgi:GTP-binding protein
MTETEKEKAKIVKENLPTIALVGRVNVGKSTLFNRLTGTDKALTSGTAGTTRTSNVGTVNWQGKNFRLVDTGGLTFSEDVLLEKDIIEQTKVALKEAHVILFIVDLQDMLLPQEKTLATTLLKKYHGKKPIHLIGNKADSPEYRMNAHNKEWLKLGMGEPLPLSSANGSGVGDMLDMVFKDLNKLKIRPKKETELKITKVALIGKPNVGKSTLFNKIIGKDVVIVSNMPHTTREPYDTLVKKGKTIYQFIDTAGIRKKAKVTGYLERQGIGKSLAIIKKADIVLFLLDASEPITDQDKQLGGYLQEHAKSAIIIVNKWDLAEENTDAFTNQTKEMVYDYFPHLSYAPIIFISAKTGYRIHNIFDLIDRAAKERQVKISDEDLSEFLKLAIRKHLPSRGKGIRHPKIIGFRQIDINPPVFEMGIKAKTSLHDSYIHFLKNRLRERFTFFATPVIIKLRKIKK